MKNLVIVGTTAVNIDPATLDIQVLNSDREAIQRVFRVKEDCNVKAQFGEESIEKDAKAGDIIITFYEKDYPHKMVIIHNDEWNENLAAYDAKMQALKEKWAKENSENAECKTDR